MVFIRPLAMAISMAFLGMYSCCRSVKKLMVSDHFFYKFVSCRFQTRFTLVFNLDLPALLRHMEVVGYPTLLHCLIVVVVLPCAFGAALWLLQRRVDQFGDAFCIKLNSARRLVCELGVCII